MFDESDHSIYFEMPFDWSPDYVEQVFVVHEEVRVPKEFAPYSEGRQFIGYVNGVQLGARALINDPYSYEDTNVIHFLVTNTDLENINAELGSNNHDNRLMTLKLVPQDEVVANTQEFYLVDTVNFERVPTNVVVQWDSAYGAGDNIPFEIAFFDDAGNLVKDARYGYLLVQDGGDHHGVPRGRRGRPRNTLRRGDRHPEDHHPRIRAVHAGHSGVRHRTVLRPDTRGHRNRHPGDRPQGRRPHGRPG